MLNHVKDAIAGAQLAPVQRERISLLEHKISELKEKNSQLTDENSGLKALVSSLQQRLDERIGISHSLSLEKLAPDAHRVLAALLGSDITVKSISGRLGILPHLVEYQLDYLADYRFADCGCNNPVTGEAFWSITKEGRRFAIEQGLGGQ